MAVEDGLEEERKVESLVSTEWLAAEMGASDLRIVDCTKHLPDTGRDPLAEYEAGHIPGARNRCFKDNLGADGRFKHFLDQAVVLRDAEGRPVEYAGTLLDVTDRKELENQLVQVQKMDAIGKLTGGIAHDFNNLLSVIRLSNQLAAEQTRPTGTAKENVELVTDIAEHPRHRPEGRRQHPRQASVRNSTMKKQIMIALGMALLPALAMAADLGLLVA